MQLIPDRRRIAWIRLFHDRNGFSLLKNCRGCQEFLQAIAANLFAMKKGFEYA
ncbi:hypothetical protein PY365_15605 [Roseiarcaceae bacterium H3SJ34-1]|uniref:hypothetical protein n=1 Tax=Terripilifer ovatus TaxID=3032367 RepID=UPI003AB999C3|nr:hypothetical protein [Roseiarcaceae bacterium H3SJ34-1]